MTVPWSNHSYGWDIGMETLLYWLLSNSAWGNSVENSSQIVTLSLLWVWGSGFKF